MKPICHVLSIAVLLSLSLPSFAQEPAAKPKKPSREEWLKEHPQEAEKLKAQEKEWLKTHPEDKKREELLLEVQEAVAKKDKARIKELSTQIAEMEKRRGAEQKVRHEQLLKEHPQELKKINVPGAGTAK